MTPNDNNDVIAPDEGENDELRALILLDARTRELDERERAFAEGLALREEEARTALLAQMDEERAEHVRQIGEERAQRLELLDQEVQAMRARAVEELARRQETEDAALRDARARAQRAMDEERERHDAALRQERGRHEAALREERERQDSAVRQERERFDADRAKAAAALEAREEAIEQVVSRQHVLQMELKERERALAQQDVFAQRAMEERVRWVEQAAQSRQLALESDLRRANDQVAGLESRLRRLDELEVRFGDSAEAVLQRMDAAESKATQLQEELQARPSLEERIELRALREEKRGWAEQLERQGFELSQLKTEKHRWVVGVADLEHQKRLAEIGNRHIQALEVKIQSYGEQVDRLQALQGQSTQREARMAPLEVPQFKDYQLADRKHQPSEQQWLEQIRSGCESLGIHFPRRLLYAFHTSLKAAESSALTVLAGVSGTGKSALPRLYSRLGGVAFLHLPVQPNWDGPQSLFGYYNPLDSRFHATPLLRAMVQAQRDNPAHPGGLADRMMMVLLDEMNLAHVELYFSDLLSRLEMRHEGAVTQPIDLGADVEPFELPLGDNLLFVGTMNEDETTKSLSDKVVDRANTLYFPRPRQLYSRKHSPTPSQSPLLSVQVWRGWIGRGTDLPAQQVARFREALEEINQHLEHAGRALAHRVWQAVETYMANHPDVLAARRDGDEARLERALQLAFEDQLVLKVMPKLRGIETSGSTRSRCLNPIRSLLDRQELGLSLGEDFDIACASSYGVFAWNSARYLDRESA